MKRNTKVSFIPQKSLAKEDKKRTLSINIFLLVSLVVFFLTIASYGGLLIYKTNLDKTIKGKEKELTVGTEKSNSLDVINKAKNLQKKINNVAKLLNRHVAPSRIFTFLEEVTLKKVRFQELDFGKNDDTVKENTLKNTAGDYSIKLKGEAPSYASLAYQVDVLNGETGKDGRIKDFTISDIVLDKNGGVLFSANIILKSNFFLYKAEFTDSKKEESEVSTGEGGIKTSADTSLTAGTKDCAENSDCNLVIPTTVSK